MFGKIQAELLKLKYPPVLWLMGATVMSISFLIYFAHSNDVESLSAIGRNPWVRIWDISMGIFSVFMTVPFIVMLISAAIYIEFQNNIWKYQYSAPITRYKVLLIKLCSILILLLTTYLLLAVGVFCAAWMLNYFLPETEFSYYPIQFFNYYEKAFFTLINSLGIIGIQFFMSIRFKGFLVPAGIGIVAFIIALIIGVNNTPISHYFPYCYTLIGQDFNMFTIDKIGIKQWGAFNSVQLCSVLTFLFFILVSLFVEDRRDI